MNIEAISVDLLQEFFLTVLNSIGDREWRHPSPWNRIGLLPRTLGAVCRRWRSTALSTPNLWAVLVMNEKTKIEAVQLCLRRSEQSLLRLFFFLTPANDPSMGGLRAGGRVVNHMNEILQVISPHYLRCGSIVHDTAPYDRIMAPFLKRVAEYQGGFSSLIRLSILGAGDHRLVELDPVRIITFPGSLVELKRLDMGTPFLQMPPGAYNKLTTLHLSMEKRPIHEVCVIISKFKVLKTLALCGDFNWDKYAFINQHPYHFPHLKSLYGYQTSELPLLMRLLHAPSLRHVALISAFESTFTQLKYLTRSVHSDLDIGTIPPFQRLTLSIVDGGLPAPTEEWVRGLFELFPWVEEVTLAGSKVSPVIHALLVSPSIPVWWPQLRVLGVEAGAATSNIDAIQELIWSRQFGGIPILELHSDEIGMIHAGLSSGDDNLCFEQTRVFRDVMDECMYDPIKYKCRCYTG